jgi:hypothetical protein
VLRVSPRASGKFQQQGGSPAGDNVKRAAGVLLTIITIAACSEGSRSGPASGNGEASGGLYDGLPTDLAALIARDAERHWTLCEDVWVTRNSGRNGQGHPHAFIMAGALRIHSEGSLDGVGDGPPARIRVSSGMHRVYQSEDIPRRQPARGPGWSDWVALSAPELPVWSVRRAGDGWDVTFRPDAGEDDDERYAIQYDAPDCGEIPPG